MDATNVSTAKVIIALTSMVGASVACPAQEDNMIQSSRTRITIRLFVNIDSFWQACYLHLNLDPDLASKVARPVEGFQQKTALCKTK